MINNRQNGRRRGRGGGGGGQRPGGGQRDSGNRIDSRARGNAAQLLEKYKNMASDAQRQGDRVQTEYYLQFADHYFRVLSDQRGRSEDQGQRAPIRDTFDDDDFGDEGEAVRGDEQPRGREDRGAGRYDGDRGYRGEPPRDDRAAREHRAVRDEPARAEPAREEEPRGEVVRDERPRRGRPRRDEARDAAAPRATEPANDMGEPAFDAGILPPALGAAPAPDDGEEAPRPRRRRRVAPAGTGQPG